MLNGLNLKYYHATTSLAKARIVHENTSSCHVNINNLPYFDTDWQFEMLKRGKLMDTILIKCIFQKRVSLISVTFVVGTHRGNSNLHL